MCVDLKKIHQPKIRAECNKFFMCIVHILYAYQIAIVEMRSSNILWRCIAIIIVVSMVSIVNRFHANINPNM